MNISPQIPFKSFTRLVVFSVFFVFVCYRAYIVGYVSHIGSGYTLTDIMLQTLMNDIYIILFILLLEVFAILIQFRILSVIARSFVILIMLLYLVDVLVFKYLTNRINFDDILLYGGEFSAVIDMIGAVSETKFGLISLFLIAIFLFCMPVYVFLSKTKFRFSGVKYLTSITVVVALSFLVLDNSVSQVSSSNLLLVRTGNIFYTLSNNSYKREYSDEFKDKAKSAVIKFNDSKICSKGRNQNKNVILLVVESLSSYHSSFFSGINNFTPNLDKIASENISFKNFHANGFSTVGGYMSIMNGLIPIPKTQNAHTQALGGWIALSGFETNPFIDSMPKIFNELGYQTIFLSNGDLSFAGSNNWLKEIGFKYVEDATSPDYEGKERFLFNAPADRALFSIAKNKISNQKNKYLMVLSTISTHRPYLDVNTGKPTTEGQSFKEFDKELGMFYKFLSDSNYFENGILLITGDHRAMSPPLHEEKVLYKTNTGDRVPFVLVDKSFLSPKIVSEHYQHIDILPSLQTFAGDMACSVSLFGNFYSIPPRAPECTYFARGDNRNIVSVSCGQEEADVILSGDKTRFINGKVSNAKTIIEYINAIRLH